MPTTTIDAIVDKMVDTIEDLIPSLHAKDSFRPWDEVADDFRAWCEANANACFRRFAVLDTGDVEQPMNTNLDVEEVYTTITVLIAYPRKDATRYGAKMSRGRNALIGKDRVQINDAVGTNGYSTLDQTTSGAATVWTVREAREEGEACVFAVLELRTRFWRAV